MAEYFRVCLSLIGLTLFVWVLRTEGLIKSSSIRLENNEYKGIVVAIHPDEAENTEIIDIIKGVFTNGSSYLYNATKKRAFFEEVTILIPETWSDHPSYTSPGSATLNGADVIIAGYNPRFAPDGENSAAPYTKHLEAGCGKQALYIHMTSYFLQNYRVLQEYYGDYGRVLVHEWGHYRWGLFNEYPDVVTDRYNVEYFYYSDSNRIWEPVSCSNRWRLQYLKNNLNNEYRVCNGNEHEGYEIGCVTQPFPEQPFVSGSIMHSYLNFPQVVNFCDSDADDPSYLHNSEAPTKQNKWCDGKSSWEVMREHPDFKDNNNPPREVDDVTPTFHVVRSRPARVVLVLDTSGSMSTHDRHLKLADAARTYILSVAPLGTSVGIVDFDISGKIVSRLTELTSDQVRTDLSNQVPQDADGGTCIGCGLEEALRILTAADGNADGGKIMLITDGQDGEPDFTEQMKIDCIENNVIIDSIAFSENAEPNLVDLSTSTGGRLFLQTDNRNSTGIRDAFAASTEGTSEHERPVELSSEIKTFATGEREHWKSIYIDETIGRSTTFDFTYFSTGQGSALDVIITSPSGVTFDRTSPSYLENRVFKKITIKINDIAEHGSWEYLLRNQISDQSYDVIATVSSFPSKEGVSPILVSSFLSGSPDDIMKNKPFVAYAEVKQGFFPVIRATVIATIETPGDPVELNLFDTGAGADITKDDGIYSRYFTQFIGLGFYGMKVRVENNGEAIILKPSVRSPYSGVDMYFNPEILLAGNLSEFGNLNITFPGAPLKELEGVPAPNFTRGVSGGAARISNVPEGWSPEADTVAPNKITDLEVVNASVDAKSITVTFTAPGDDLDFGNAHHYVLHWSKSPHELRNNLTSCPRIHQNNVTEGNLSSPAPFGIKEVITFLVPLPEDVETMSFMIGVYAVDDVDNEGVISNIERATFRRYIPPSFEDLETTTEQPALETTTKKESETSSNKSLIVWLSVLIILVIVVVIVITLLVARYHKRKGGNSNSAYFSVPTEKVETEKVSV